MSKTVHYTDDTPSAPVGYDVFHPGEERTVSDQQAAELERNVHFKLVDEAPPPAEEAGAVADVAAPEASPGLVVTTTAAAPTDPAQGGS